MVPERPESFESSSHIECEREVDNNNSPVSFYPWWGQINLHRSVVSATSLNQFLGILPTLEGPSKPKFRSGFIVALQEPPTSKHTKVMGFNKKHNLIYDRQADRPRAALFHSSNPNLWPVPEYTDADMATAIWSSPHSHLGDIIVTSVYMDITDPRVWPPKLEPLLRRCRQLRREVLVLADANAHSTLWGQAPTNARGQALEELILKYHLSVMNTGTDYTFFNKRARTNPDVSLCSPALAGEVEDWRVSKAVQGTDHCLISFRVNIKAPAQEPRRSFRGGDWERFRRLLDSASSPVDALDPDSWTREQIEQEVATWTGHINSALDRTHPKIRRSTAAKPFSWWDGNLQTLHRQFKVATNVFHRNKSHSAYHTMKAARSVFKKALRKAKRKSWQLFASEAATPEKAAHFMKVVKGQLNQSLGLLKRHDGSYFELPADSLDHLVNTHFPGNSSSPPPSPLWTFFLGSDPRM